MVAPMFRTEVDDFICWFSWYLCQDFVMNYAFGNKLGPLLQHFLWNIKRQFYTSWRVTSSVCESDTVTVISCCYRGWGWDGRSQVKEKMDSCLFGFGWNSVWSGREIWFFDWGAGPDLQQTIVSFVFISPYLHLYFWIIF